MHSDDRRRKGADFDALQKDFEDTYQRKVVADARQASLEMQPTRKALGYRINALFGYINTNEIEGLSESSMLPNELNEAINEIESKAKARRARRKNNSQEAAQPPTPPPDAKA
jgi:hypothetical protein